MNDFTFFYPLRRDVRREVNLRRIRDSFGKLPERTSESSIEAIWATIPPHHNNMLSTVLWARHDGTPPEIHVPADVKGGDKGVRHGRPERHRLPMPITEPIYVPVWHNTTRRDIYKSWQLCQRTMRRYDIHNLARQDRRFERGCRYWMSRYGLQEVQAAAFMPSSVLAYLATPTRRSPRRLVAVQVKAAQAKDKGLSIEIVRRDVAHFKKRADAIGFIVAGWRQRLMRMNLSAEVLKWARDAETLGDLVRLIERLPRYPK